MGTAAFERDAVVEIDGQKYRLLRKVSETCWQLEHTKTARISELEEEELLRLYAGHNALEFWPMNSTMYFLPSATNMHFPEFLQGFRQHQLFHGASKSFLLLGRRELDNSSVSFSFVIGTLVAANNLW